MHYIVNSKLLCIIYHIFGFNLFNAEKCHSNLAQEGKLNCNKCIHFLIIPMKEIWLDERLFFELFIENFEVAFNFFERSKLSSPTPPD